MRVMETFDRSVDWCHVMYNDACLHVSSDGSICSDRIRTDYRLVRLTLPLTSSLNSNISSASRQLLTMRCIVTDRQTDRVHCFTCPAPWGGVIIAVACQQSSQHVKYTSELTSLRLRAESVILLFLDTVNVS